jgi:hypothetical protein
MILVPLFDLKFLTEFAAGVLELQIGGTRSAQASASGGSLQTVGLRAHSHWKICRAAAMTRFLVCGRFDSA